MEQGARAFQQQMFPEVLFYYRQHNANMTKQMDKDLVGNFSRLVFRHHRRLYGENIHTLFAQARLGYGLLIEPFFITLMDMESPSQPASLKACKGIWEISQAARQAFTLRRAFQ